MWRDKRKALAALFLAAVLPAAAALAETTLYVRSTTATIRAGQTSLDPVVAHLRQGEAVRLVERQGPWARVRLGDGREGWVYFSKLTEEKPESGVSLLARIARITTGGEATATAGSVAARGLDLPTRVELTRGERGGLDPLSASYAERKGIPAETSRAVAELKESAIREGEAEAFLREGRLGEFRR